MTANKYVHFDSSVFFEISGIDKEKFLQALITNDINKCHHNKTIYSAFLTPQGKFIADFFILNLGSSYLFETREPLFNNLIEKFNIYKLRAKINIIENKKYKSIAIINNIGLIKNNNLGELKKITEGYIFIDPRNSKMGIKAYIEKENIKNFYKKYLLSEDNIENYHNKRIENLIPDSLLDLEVNKSSLLENNFESINAIDWNKGCYIGQEVTARMKYRGKIKKFLKRFLILEGNIKGGDQVFYNNQLIGTVCSNTKINGLALLRMSEEMNNSKNEVIMNTKKAKIKVNY